MVIQANMSPKAIVEIWDITKQVFEKHGITLTEKRLETVFQGKALKSLLEELNETVGSSMETCIEGG